MTDFDPEPAPPPDFSAREVFRQLLAANPGLALPPEAAAQIGLQTRPHSAVPTAPTSGATAPTVGP